MKWAHDLFCFPANVWIWRGCASGKQAFFTSRDSRDKCSSFLLSTCRCLKLPQVIQTSSSPAILQSTLLSLSLLSTNGGWRTVTLACITTSRARTLYLSVLRLNWALLDSCGFSESETVRLMVYCMSPSESESSITQSHSINTFFSISFCFISRFKSCFVLIVLHFCLTFSFDKFLFI